MEIFPSVHHIPWIPLIGIGIFLFIMKHGAHIAKQTWKVYRWLPHPIACCISAILLPMIAIVGLMSLGVMCGKPPSPDTMVDMPIRVLYGRKVYHRWKRISWVPDLTIA